MKFFYDTEFIETGPGHPIFPLSIGIASERGEEFYAVFQRTEEELALANEFVWTHVLPKLKSRPLPQGLSAFVPAQPLEEIREDLLGYIGDETPEFWSYYADYDHVILCQIFGRMVDLPEGWPKYTLDVKQWAVQLEERAHELELPKDSEEEHHALHDARWIRRAWKVLQEHEREWEKFGECGHIAR
jgi:hypothetical protein